MTRLVLSLAVLSLTACDDVRTDADLADDYAAHGPRHVGHTTLIQETPRGPLSVSAWYPTNEDRDEAITYAVALGLPFTDGSPVDFLGAAIADAAPATDDTYPLVVLSHGFVMNPEWYHPLAEHLASHGYVVLAPQHGETDWAPDVVRATVERPLEVSATIDLAEDGALDGIIDAERVAVIGHSYGGYTALAAGGARIQTDWLEASCPEEEDPFVQGMFCAPFLGGEALAAELGLDAVPDGLWPDLSDDRVDAVVAMAPNAYLFGDVGMAELDKPLLVMGGTGDTAAPWGWGSGLAHDYAGSDVRALVAFEGADHFVQTTTCDHMPWTDELPPEFRTMFCEDPAWDKEAALAVTLETTAAFLGHTLGEEPCALHVLSNDHFDHLPGLDVQLEIW